MKKMLVAATIFLAITNILATEKMIDNNSLQSKKLVFVASTDYQISCNMLAWATRSNLFTSIANDPFCPAYTKETMPRVFSDIFKDQSPTTGKNINNFLNNLNQDGHAYVHVNATPFLWFINKDPYILKRPNIKFVEIVTDLHKISRRNQNWIELEILSELSNRFKKLNNEEEFHPLNAAELKSNPQTALKTFLNFIDSGLGDKQIETTWKAFGADYDGAGWHEWKLKDQLHTLESMTCKCTSFGTKPKYKAPAQLTITDKNDLPNIMYNEDKSLTSTYTPPYRDGLYSLNEELTGTDSEESGR